MSIYSGGGIKRFDDGSYGYEIKLYCSYHGMPFTTITKSGFETSARAGEESNAIHADVKNGKANRHFGVTECAVCKPLCASCSLLSARKQALEKEWNSNSTDYKRR